MHGKQLSLTCLTARLLQLMLVSVIAGSRTRTKSTCRSA
jgi:hypothetical protein